MLSIRGATTVSENTRTAILEASEELLHAVIVANRLEPEDISEILFTATDDLTASYPAPAARAIGITGAALMCVAEMPVEGSLRKCIRLLMRAESKTSKTPNAPNASSVKPRHVYRRGASALRPDLALVAVAIDGPNNAGKSTVARLLAKKLNADYIDTGALYRAVALYNLRNGNDLRDGNAVIASLPNINIEVEFRPEGTPDFILNGETVTSELYTPKASEGASLVGVYPEVRDKLLRTQQYFALTRRIVMDGRDIGTRVLPWATVKIYLDARLDVQVEREIKKRRLQNKGLSLDPAEVRREVAERDERDKNRAVAPLTRADDAVYIDSSDMTPEETIEEICRRCGGCFTISANS
jgi:cytidylate kinase